MPNQVNPSGDLGYAITDPITLPAELVVASDHVLAEIVRGMEISREAGGPNWTAIYYEIILARVYHWACEHAGEEILLDKLDYLVRFRRAARSADAASAPDTSQLN
jgi:hypothetical protein